MHKYEEDMAELTRQRLAVYRERLEDSKKELDMKIDQLETKKFALENTSSHVYPALYATLQHPTRSVKKRSKLFLSTSAENLTNVRMQDTVASHPHLLDVSFLTKPIDFSSHRSSRTVYRPTPRYPLSATQSYDQLTRQPGHDSGNLSHMEGLSRSQQAILDETAELVKDSQQLHTESACQFERARESLLSR